VGKLGIHYYFGEEGVQTLFYQWSTIADVKKMIPVYTYLFMVSSEIHAHCKLIFWSLKMRRMAY
jgi:hypothetical protein